MGPGDEWMLLYAVAVAALGPVAVFAEIEIVVAVVVVLSCEYLLLVAVFEGELVEGHDPIDSFDDSDENIRCG